MAAKKKRKRMGRPHSPNPRKSFIGLKVTADERRWLEREARAAELSLSEFLMAPHRARMARKEK
jgi:uncharacterized protein (DUF1778 family)